MTDGGKLAVVAALFGSVLLGWGLAGLAGGALGLVLGAAAAVLPWWGQSAWSWLALFGSQRRKLSWADPTTVVNDRSGGGVRCTNGVAVVAVQVLGRPYRPTWLTGSTGTRTDNEMDLALLRPLLRQSMDLAIESISLVSVGARRQATGDYPRVYDTLIGTPPYAGQRETWVIARIPIQGNANALRNRMTVGTAALATAQRIGAALRTQGVRAKVANAAELIELERRVGAAGLQPDRQGWKSVRDDLGWMTSYWYPPASVCAETLSSTWSLAVDGVVQNLTLFDDGTLQASCTVRTRQPPVAPPSVAMRTLSGQQSAALAAAMCGPTVRLRGVRVGPIPPSLAVPVGSSGVLVGKTRSGDRLLLPISDPGELTRVHIAADDRIAMRLIVRMAAMGERITVHTNDIGRWTRIRMPNIAVVTGTKPVANSTISVVDGSIQPVPRPDTVVTVTGAGQVQSPAADVTISQTGPGWVQICTPDWVGEAEVELFRVENRYVSAQHVSATGS